MAREPYTSYWIWPPHSWLKRRAHKPKNNRTWEQSAPSLFLITVDVGRQNFATCLPRPTSLTDPTWAWASSRSTQELLVSDRFYQVPGSQKVVAFIAWRVETWPQEPTHTWQHILNYWNPSHQCLAQQSPWQKTPPIALRPSQCGGEQRSSSPPIGDSSPVEDRQWQGTS
jgi:hypothetical protein